MSLVTHVNPYNGLVLSSRFDGFYDEQGNVFPLVKGVYRFVKSSNNYTDNFGYQWNKFTETQVDKLSQITLSQNRFFAETNWDKENLEGKNMLEVGSGAGRFTQIALDHTKAEIYSVDFSNAVDANFRNNGPHKRLNLYQASIYELPFAKGSFDKVFCFGVLQHTPDVKRSVKSLIDMVAPGGELVVDFYPVNGWWTKIHAKYLLRPFTRTMSHIKLYNIIESNADCLINAYRFFTKFGKVGRTMTRLIPVCDIDGTLPKGLPKEKLREMVVLDTFDMFSPAYDQPQKIETVKKWFLEFGMERVWGGTIVHDEFRSAVVKGKKPL